MRNLAIFVIAAAIGLAGCSQEGSTNTANTAKISSNSDKAANTTPANQPANTGNSATVAEPVVIPDKLAITEIKNYADKLKGKTISISGVIQSIDNGKVNLIGSDSSFNRTTVTCTGDMSKLGAKMGKIKSRLDEGGAFPKALIRGTVVSASASEASLKPCELVQFDT